MKQPTLYTVFVSSPSDADEERKAITEIIPLTNSILKKANIFLQPVNWELDLSPSTGATQDRINNELLTTSNFCIAILKNELGTPVNGYESGTVSEIEYFLRNEKKVMLYVSEKTLSNKAKKYVHKLRNRLTYFNYTDLYHFKFYVFFYLIKDFFSGKHFTTATQLESFIQINPNNPLLEIKSENVHITSITDNGHLDITLNFTNEIDPKKLSIMGFPFNVNY